MSATSLDDTGYEDLPSDQDEEGSTSDSKSGNVKFAENEKVVSIDEIAKTEDVIMEKSVEDDIGQKSMEEDVMQKFVEDDVLKKSVDVTQKSVEEAVLETSIADYGGETSVEEYTAKSDDKDNEVFPRELLMNTKVVTPETKDIPTPSAEATTFFSLLAEEDLKSLIYKDSLITTSSDGDLGEFLISIDTCTFQEEECYNISAKSVGNIEGILCGTSLVAYVNKNLQTLEQRHHEYVELNPCPLDRKTLITRRNGLYIFTKTISEGQESYQIQKAWNINDLPILILEGANTLLLRILITKGAALKDFNVPTLDSDGYLCKSEYKSLGMRNIVINKEDINTIVLQRTIFSKIDAPISWNYNFMDDA